MRFFVDKRLNSINPLLDFADRGNPAGTWVPFNVQLELICEPLDLLGQCLSRGSLLHGHGGHLRHPPRAAWIRELLADTTVHFCGVEMPGANLFQQVRTGTIVISLFCSFFITQKIYDCVVRRVQGTLAEAGGDVQGAVHEHDTAPGICSGRGQAAGADASDRCADSSRP